MEIQSVAVIGAGTMGSGIASTAAAAGFDVILMDVAEPLLQKGAAAVDKHLSRAVEKQLMTPAEKAAAAGRVRTTTDLGAARGCDLFIEAVTEDATVKAGVFAAIARVAPREAIIATNTSALKISDLAALTPEPARVLGMHFFNPVPAMRLVELVRTETTSEAALAAARRFVEALGKQPVVLAESCGFIVNRLLIPMINEAAALLGEGVATAADIDKAMELGANHPVGPLALADRIGLDVCLAIMDTLRAGLNSPRYEPAARLRELVSAGKLGRKSGEGFYKY